MAGVFDNETGRVKFSDGQILQFQNGVVSENGVNGIQLDELIDAAIIRLEYLDKRHHDRYNAETLKALYTASDYQNLRTLERQNAGVEGQEIDYNPE